MAFPYPRNVFHFSRFLVMAGSLFFSSPRHASHYGRKFKTFADIIIYDLGAFHHFLLEVKSALQWDFNCTEKKDSLYR